MSYARKPVCFRLNGGPCQKGYQDVNCNTGEVYDAPDAGAVITGVLVTPCGDCPDEVVLAAALRPALNCDMTTMPVMSAGPVQTIPHPDHVQRVTICRPDGAVDREVAVWCDSDTGEAVTVVTLWPAEAAVGSPPIVETYTAFGLPWTGDVLKLTKCAPRDLDPVTEQVCVGGQSYTRTTFFDADLHTVSWVVWQDVTGAPVAAPTGTAKLGACADVTPIKVAWLALDLSLPYSGEGPPPIGAITGTALQTLLGSTALLSITVKQYRGTGQVIGAAGTYVSMERGETWSWGSHGADQEDVLDPNFSLLAGSGGGMRLIVTYRAP